MLDDCLMMRLGMDLPFDTNPKHDTKLLVIDLLCDLRRLQNLNLPSSTPTHGALFCPEALSEPRPIHEQWPVQDAIACPSAVS